MFFLLRPLSPPTYFCVLLYNICSPNHARKAIGVKRLTWTEKDAKRKQKQALQDYERDLIRQGNEEKKV
jgi:hypothetical protein